MQIDLDKSSSAHLAAATRSARESLHRHGGRVVDGVEGEEVRKDMLKVELQKAEITELKACIAQLHLEQAKADATMKGIQQLHRSEAEEREGALNVVEKR